MEQINTAVCLACGNPCSQIIASVKDHEYRSSLSIYQYLECTKCFSLKIHPAPTDSEIQAAYPKEYYSFHLIQNYLKFKDTYWGKKFYTSLKTNFTNNIKNWATFLNKDGHSLRVLDYGTGEGFTLQILSEVGITKEHLFGYEPHSNSKNNSKSFNIISKHNELKQLNQKFDIILASHVIEHLNNPEELFKDSSDILNDGGLLIITLPTPEGIHYKLTARHHWGGYHAPRHLNILTRQGVYQIAQKYPFSLLSTKALDDSWIMAQTLNSVLSKAPQHLIPNWLKNSIYAGSKEEPTFSRVVLYKLMSILSLWLIKLKNQSSNTEIIFRKNTEGP